MFVEMREDTIITCLVAPPPRIRSYRRAKLLGILIKYVSVPLPPERQNEHESEVGWGRKSNQSEEKAVEISIVRESHELNAMLIA